MKTKSSLEEVLYLQQKVFEKRLPNKDHEFSNLKVKKFFPEIKLTWLLINVLFFLLLLLFTKPSLFNVIVNGLFRYNKVLNLLDLSEIYILFSFLKI